MNPIDRLAEWCVARAARRWPEDLSETLCREWRAELVALRTEPGLGPMVRSRRAIAFAASLACSPAVEAEGEPIPTWRDRLAGVGRASTALAGAAGVTLLAAALFNGVHDAYHGLSRHVSAPVGIAADVALVAAAVAVMAWVGVVAGRRGRWPAGARSAARYVLPFGLTMFAFLLSGNEIAIMPFMGWIDVAPAVAVWTVLTTLTLGLATRVAASGRRRLGLSAATVGTVVALECAAALGSLHAATTLRLGLGSAPAWFPLALLPGGTAGFGRLPADAAAALGGRAQPGAATHASDILLGNASAMVGPLLLCSAFVVAYAMRVTGGAVPAPAADDGPVSADDGPAPVSRPIGAAALGLGGAGLAIWVSLAAVVDGPGPAARGDVGPLRTAALVLTVSALAVVLAGRGPVVVPSIGAFVVLSAADRVAGRAEWHGPAAAVGLAALGAATVYAGWLACVELARPGAEAGAGRRRRLVAVAVLAALAVPTAESGQPPAPGGVVALGCLLAVLTWVLAITAAAASRRTPLGRVSTLTAIVAPLVLLVLVTTAPGIGTRPYEMHMSLLIRVLLAVAALAVAGWDGSARRARRAAAWSLLGLGAALLSLPVSDALRLSDELVGTTVARIAHNTTVFGFGFASTAVGQLALAVLLGVLAAGWLAASESESTAGRVPPDRPAPGTISA
jgi:hypothetical protein